MESELRDEARPINPIGGQIKSGLKKYIYCAQTQSQAQPIIQCFLNTITIIAFNRTNQPSSNAYSNTVIQAYILLLLLVKD